MNRIPPSEQVQKQIAALLQGQMVPEEDLVSQLLLLGSQKLAQELLEQEVTDYLGREHYQRREANQEHRGYRNGYRAANMDTAEGRIPIQVPQVRDSTEPYHSKLAAFLKGHSDVLEQLALEMYTRGLSTRDIEDTFRDVTGDQLLSRTAVSVITEQLWDEYRAFSERDLTVFDVDYLFLDGVYESLRRLSGMKEGILVAWAICHDGQKVLIHMAVGNKESYPAWQDFIRGMQKRGLRVPVLISTDGAPGLIRAVEEAWPDSLRQRCLAHKIRNVLDKVSDQDREEVRAMVQSAWYAPNRKIGEMIATDVLSRFQEEYPAAMKSFLDDLEACWAYLKCPAVHRRRIRTTNMLERAFVEQRRRTKIIPGFWTEESCMKLAFATLWRASQRWNGVRMTEFEQAQLRTLRAELGLLPPDQSTDRRRKAA
jgi:putative transposase